MRLFVDTNVLLDALKSRKPNERPAKKLLALGFVREFELWVSAGQVKDLVYFLTDGGKPSLAQDAMRKVAQLHRFVNVCSLTDDDLLQMTRMAWPDPEDALIDIAARKVKAEAIVTQNLRDFGCASVRVFDCEGLFAFLEQEKGIAFDLVDW